MPHRQLLSAAFRCGKTRSLIHAATEAVRVGTPPAAILALAAHQPAVALLRDGLRQAAAQPVPTTTLRQRALTILKQHPAAASLPAHWDESMQLSGIDRRLLIRRAWAAEGSRSDSLYARRADQPGALDWIALLFDQFSAWAGSAQGRRLPGLAIADPPLAELWRSYTRYLDLCWRHGVVAFNEVFNRAIDALRVPQVRSAQRPRLLLLDDLDLFRPDELLFAAALIGPGTDVFAATSYAPRADSPLALDQLLRSWAADLGLTIVADNTTAAAPQTEQIACATPDDEAHAIARQVAEHVAGGAQPDECAIVLFDSGLLPPLHRALARRRLPFAGAEPRDGYTLALAPLALAGLKLIANVPFTGAEAIALLRHPALDLPTADAHLLAEALKQGLFDPWSANDGRWPEGLSPLAIARIRDLRTATTAAQRVDAPPSAKIRSWLHALDLPRLVWEYTDVALEPWAARIDRQHWDRMLFILQQSEQLRAALGDPLTPADAVDVWVAARALISPEGKPVEHAVQIWSPNALGGCTARHVFIAGLHEGALPPPLPPLPVADDALLAAAFGALPGFAAPQITDQAAAWARGHHDLHRAIGRASESATLSYSRTDREGRRRLPSRLLEAGDWRLEDRGAKIGRQEGTIVRTMRASPQLPAPSPRSLAPLPVSPSQIEDYFVCPRRCFFARELGLYDVSSSPRQALGNVVHHALHDLLRDAAALPISEARAASLVEQHWISDEHRWGSKLKRAVFRRIAERAAMQLARYEIEEGGAGSGFVGGEILFTWNVPEANALVRGRIDRIDRGTDGLHVIDYKLGQHSPSINDLLREFVPPRDPVAAQTWRPGDIQLPVYALAVENGEVEGLERAPNERVSSVALVYPLELYGDNGKASVKGRRVIAIVDHAAGCVACEAPPQRSTIGYVCRDQLNNVKARMVGAIELMRAGEWSPDPREGSRTCGSCAFRPICPGPQ